MNIDLHFSFLSKQSNLYFLWGKIEIHYTPLKFFGQEKIDLWPIAVFVDIS